MRNTLKAFNNRSKNAVSSHHQAQLIGLVENNQAWSVVHRWPFLTTTLLVSLLIVMTAGLSGCGFHLRGLDSLGEMQYKTVKLESTAGVRPEVLQAIRSQLAQSGVKLVDSIATAEVEIVLRPTVYKASRTAYSGLGDTTAEFLRMEQGFVATWVATEESLVTSSVQTYRDRQINTSALLAANRELRSIHREMAEDLARKMINRINRTILKVSSRVSGNESEINKMPVDTPQKAPATNYSPTKLPKSAD